MIGIRWEDKNEWERRAPLSPEHVARLVADGLAVRVQPSAHRVFSDEDYRTAGASIDRSLTACSVVLGIKEIPAPQLEASKAYVFFSHTTKAQSHNMPMLRRVLELGATLLDYEQVRDQADRRLIFFGRQAGHAGMIDGLWAFGQRLLAEGLDSPFATLEPAHRYRGLAEAKQAIARVGAALRRDGLGHGLPPLVCGITGTGNVSRGAEEVYDELQPESLHPNDLAGAKTQGRLRSDRAYKVVFDLDERYRRIEGGPVRLPELAEHPERFENNMLGYLPHVSLLVNGMFWVPELPFLLRRDDLRRLWTSGELRGLRVIADISCDIDGAVEATVKATTPDAPVFVFDVDSQTPVDGFHGNGPTILAVDNLPAELPRESSEEFGDALFPFVAALAACDWKLPLDELALPPELARAVIAHQGALAPRFSYLQQHLGN